MQYIDVVIDNKSVNTDSFYTYKAPDEVGVGAKLTVPFAKRKKSALYCAFVSQVCRQHWASLHNQHARIKRTDLSHPHIIG